LQRQPRCWACGRAIERRQRGISNGPNPTEWRAKAAGNSGIEGIKGLFGGRVILKKNHRIFGFMAKKSLDRLAVMC